MKLLLSYLAANALADMSIMQAYVDFGVDDLSVAEYDSLAPTIEVYRYSDDSYVDTLVRGQLSNTGFWTSLLTGYDRSAMYFKLVAPSVRLNMRTTCLSARNYFFMFS